MSSDQAELESIETTDYLPVIIIAVVAYDYILTLSREIDYVWVRDGHQYFHVTDSTQHRPWTRVSTLFVIIRYVGLCWAVTLALGMFNVTDC
ncbi:hypothetical protein HD554DRAFT_1675673 [Boletus coccyginus]|nr:hypothetical protein HD554DRAFT_1675673 [Boletus coccyginus]